MEEQVPVEMKINNIFTSDNDDNTLTIMDCAITVNNEMRFNFIIRNDKELEFMVTDRYQQLFNALFREDNSFMDLFKPVYEDYIKKHGNPYGNLKIYDTYATMGYRDTSLDGIIDEPYFKKKVKSKAKP